MYIIEFSHFRYKIFVFRNHVASLSDSDMVTGLLAVDIVLERSKCGKIVELNERLL